MLNRVYYCIKRFISGQLFSLRAKLGAIIDEIWANVLALIIIEELLFVSFRDGPEFSAKSIVLSREMSGGMFDSRLCEWLD